MRGEGIRRRVLQSRGEESRERPRYVLWLAPSLPQDTFGRSKRPVSESEADGQEWSRDEGNEAKGWSEQCSRPSA